AAGRVLRAPPASAAPSYHLRCRAPPTQPNSGSIVDAAQTPATAPPSIDQHEKARRSADEIPEERDVSTFPSWTPPSKMVGCPRNRVNSNVHAGALFVIDDLVISSYQQIILALTRKAKLPVISQFRDFAVAGGFMAYGPNNDEMFRRAALFVDK